MDDLESIVSYTWNNIDVLSAMVNIDATPYAIPSSKLNDAALWASPSRVQIPLGLTEDPAKIRRFFREGYEWVKVPEEVQGATLIELFAALFAYDKVKFAHFDPWLIGLTAGLRNAANLKKLTNGNLVAMDPKNPSVVDPTLIAANVAYTAMKAADTSMIPFDDLARLHIDYWGNSKLRAQIVNDRIKVWFKPPEFDAFFVLHWTRVVAAVLTPILFAPFLMLDPQHFPTEKGGEKLEYVLARTAIEGQPIRALAAHDRARRPINVVSLEPPRIELDGFATQEIWPFYLREWKTSESKLRFRVTLPVPSQKTTIEIVHHRRVVYSETHDLGEFIVPGVHIFSWDCFDDDGVFDTRLLKDSGLEARVTTTDMFGRIAVGFTRLSSGPGTMRGIDARLDRKAKLAEVTMYADFRHPSDVEFASFKFPLPKAVGEALGSALRAAPVPGMELAPLIPGADMLPETQGVPIGAPLEGAPFGDALQNVPISPLVNRSLLCLSLNLPKCFELSPEDFESFKGAMIKGMGERWSRVVHLNGEEWQLVASCRERPDDSVPVYLCQTFTNAMKAAGVADESATQLLGNFLDLSFNLSALVEGLPILMFVRSGLKPHNQQHLGAHEFGHSVLREAYDPMTSASHKGTSSIIGDPSRSPKSPENDVMLYGVMETVSRAIEDDARALIWCSKIVFG